MSSCDICSATQLKAPAFVSLSFLLYIGLYIFISTRWSFSETWNDRSVHVCVLQLNVTLNCRWRQFESDSFAFSFR